MILGLRVVTFEIGREGAEFEVRESISHVEDIVMRMGNEIKLLACILSNACDKNTFAT